MPSLIPPGSKPTQSQTFTASGTWVHPAPGTSVVIWVRLWGAGGGGFFNNNSAPGGGGGGFSYDAFVVTDDVTVTVGAGGAGGDQFDGAGGDGGWTRLEDLGGSVLTAAGPGTGAPDSYTPGQGGPGALFAGADGGASSAPANDTMLASGGVQILGYGGGASAGDGGDGGDGENSLWAEDGVDGGGGGGVEAQYLNSPYSAGAGGNGGVVIIW